MFLPTRRGHQHTYHSLRKLQMVNTNVNVQVCVTKISVIWIMGVACRLLYSVTNDVVHSVTNGRCSMNDVGCIQWQSKAINVIHRTNGVVIVASAVRNKAVKWTNKWSELPETRVNKKTWDEIWSKVLKMWSKLHYAPAAHHLEQLYTSRSVV